MNANFIKKWIDDIDKIINEQIKIFDKYANENHDNQELLNYFQKMKKEFIQELEKEKIRIKKEHSNS